MKVTVLTSLLIGLLVGCQSEHDPDYITWQTADCEFNADNTMTVDGQPAGLVGCRAMWQKSTGIVNLQLMTDSVGSFLIPGKGWFDINFAGNDNLSELADSSQYQSGVTPPPTHAIKLVLASGNGNGIAAATGTVSGTNTLITNWEYFSSFGTLDNVTTYDGRVIDGSWSVRAQTATGAQNESKAKAELQSNAATGICRSPSSISGTWTGLWPAIGCCGSCCGNSPVTIHFTIPSSVASNGGQFQDDHGNTFSLDRVSCTVRPSAIDKYGAGTTGAKCGSGAGTTIYDLDAGSMTTGVHCPQNNCLDCGTAHGTLVHYSPARPS